MADRRPAGSTRWVVEPSGVLLLNVVSGATRFLSYPQAAAWDLMARGDPPARIVRKLCPIASLAPAEAEALVADLTATLDAEGFLEAENAGG